MEANKLKKMKIIINKYIEKLKRFTYINKTNLSTFKLKFKSTKFSGEDLCSWLYLKRIKRGNENIESY